MCYVAYMVHRLVPAGCAALLAALAVAAISAATSAQSLSGNAPENYETCMTLAREDPEKGFDTALSWEGLGGGDAARHCIAASLVGLGHYAEGAYRLEKLAESSAPAILTLRAELLAQSGQAWLLAGAFERAHAVQSLALGLDPNNPELLIDRSITLASAENYGEAIKDLDRAERLAPNRADILIYRASAYRYVDEEDLAYQDIQRALMLEPNNPLGLLERGILRRLSGNDAGARADWMRVISLAEDTPAADRARANLEKLDVKVE